ncbi:GHMP kinase protein [Dictyocaulus viviparus]|uniref:GHMP kinase protein n=1 Tax=Dictyocaulus viviparus TaxID=29172 RepID=A0A0D8YE85_DICVI|nr:GHMP kinase protein [Dictyocaulus viviparus]
MFASNCIKFFFDEYFFTGEHIDYHGYGVLPMATKEGVEVLAAPNEGRQIRIMNVDKQYMECIIELPLNWVAACPPKWYDYVLCGWKGILDKVGGEQIGFDLLVYEVRSFFGSIPPSSGLSSSSSLVCAAALSTWMIHTGKIFEGITRNSFLIILMIVTLQAATSHFNARVVEGRLAAKLLLKMSGMTSFSQLVRLKDVQEILGKSLNEMLELCEVLPEEVNLEQIEELLGRDVVQKCLSSNTQHLKSFKLRTRARHVYSEALRVDLFEQACIAEDLYAMGRLMCDSHRSCSKDYECSCESLDKVVEDCCAAGAYGARLTGAGWGGCAIALLDAIHPVDLGKVLFYSEPSVGINADFL